MATSRAVSSSFERFVSREVLERQPWPSYVLDEEGRLVHANSAWDRVAMEARGPLFADVAGTRWLDHIAGRELRQWYGELLERLLHGPRAGELVASCECNTPTRWRLFATWFAPRLAEEGAETGCVMVVTSMIEDVPVGERYRLASPREERFVRADGLILQCGGCRRTQTADRSADWLFVPEFVSEPRSNITHGLCSLCREVYYGRREWPPEVHDAHR